MFPNITVNKGVCPVVNGQPALLVLTNAKLPSAFFINQAQPEPNVVTAHLVNSSLNFAKEPKVVLIAFANAPVGSPPPFGVKLFQYKGVIPDLRRIIKNWTRRFYDNFFQS